MTPAIASYVSAVSVMLAAYGFFYNAFKDRIDDADKVETPAADDSVRQEQMKEIKSGRNVARLLCFVALAVWAILFKTTIDEIRKANDAGWDFDDYSTLDVVFVLLANAWFGIAILLGCRAHSLSSKLETHENYKPPGG